MSNSLLYCVSRIGGTIYVGLQDEPGVKNSYKTIVARIPNDEFATQRPIIHAILDSILWIGVSL